MTQITEEEVKEAALTLCESASNVVVSDQTGYEKASIFLKAIKDGRKIIVDFFKPMKDAASKAHKEICKKEREELEPVESAEKQVKSMMITYVNEQEKIRRIQEKKALDKAEAEAKKEREKLAAQAKKAEEKGNAEKAEEKREAAEMVYAEPVAVESTVAKTTRVENGTISTRKEIEVILPESIEGIKMLCKAIADGQVPVTCVKFSPGRLKAWAKDWKKTGPVFGMIIKETTGISVR